MRYRISLLMILTLSACSHPTERQREAQREREESDRNSAAFKVGEAAHEIAKHAEKAAAAAERKQKLFNDRLIKLALDRLAPSSQQGAK